MQDIITYIDCYQRRYVMNDLETQRLMLLPASNDRDNAQFLDMLQNDGDFNIFSGMDLTKKSLSLFNNYLEPNKFYAIYAKCDLENLVGYVGLSKQHERMEIEFYIKKDKRRNGYAHEAITALCSKAINGELEITYSEIYATTLEDNIATQILLKKCGFEDFSSENSLTDIIRIDFNSESVYTLGTKEFVLRKAPYPPHEPAVLPNELVFSVSEELIHKNFDAYTELAEG